MEAKKIISIINDIEKRFDISAWKFKDIDIWPLIRTNLYFAFSIQAFSIENQKSRKKRIWDMIMGNLNYPFQFLLDYKNNSVIKEADILFLGDGVSFSKINNKYFEKYIDPLIIEAREIGKSTLRFDPYYHYFTPRYSQSLFIQPALDKVIFKTLVSKSDIFTFKSKDEKGSFLRYIEDHGILDAESFMRDVSNRANVIYNISIFFEKKLLKIRPKVVFIVWYYGIYGMALSLACRRLKIPSVDIQHGVQGELHAAYGSWLNVPQKGYNLLPDYFWCWGKEEYVAISNWSSNCNTHQPYIGGNLLLNKWLTNNFDFIDSFDKKFLKLNLIKKKILVSLSPGLSSKENISNLYEVIAQTQDDYDWMIRLHPNMLNKKKEVEAELLSFNIIRFQMGEVTNLPLYAVLRHTDLHITHSSSTVLEAAQCGIKSIIVHRYGAELYNQQLDSGLAVLQEKTSDIIKEIKHLLKEVNLKEQTIHFDSNSENLKKFLSLLS